MRWPQTFILLAILLFLIQFLDATWVVPEAEGGGVHGGPYWNEQVYRDQQRKKRNEQRYDDVKYMQEVQRVHINNERIRRYRQGTSSRRTTSRRANTCQKTRQPSNNSWNYRRVNQ